MRRRTFLSAGAAALSSALSSALAVPIGAYADGPMGPTLTARDPQASGNAKAVYAHLVALENAARAGTSPRTILGQHIEAHNELYNPAYGDTGATTYVGYYYNKVKAITGRLPGFVEIDLGPGYGSANGWGTFNPRWYVDDLGLPSGQKQWQYADDAIDLAFDVWKGFPRTSDGTFNPDGSAVNIDGSASVTAHGLTRFATNDDVKASCYATGYVHTGGSGQSGQNFDWGSVHAD
jgi:mannan endo-1,4-beta-mannosidase